MFTLVKALLSYGQTVLNLFCRDVEDTEVWSRGLRFAIDKFPLFSAFQSHSPNFIIREAAHEHADTPDYSQPPKAPQYSPEGTQRSRQPYESDGNTPAIELVATFSDGQEENDYRAALQNRLLSAGPRSDHQHPWFGIHEARLLISCSPWWNVSRPRVKLNGSLCLHCALFLPGRLFQNREGPSRMCMYVGKVLQKGSSRGLTGGISKTQGAGRLQQYD